MARKVARFGGLVVLNPRKPYISNHGWGPSKTAEVAFLRKLTHQAENLRLRLVEMDLAGDDRAGSLSLMAEARVERRDQKRRNALAAEIKARLITARDRANMEAATEATL